MDKNKFLGRQRKRRRFGVRKKVRGDAQRPRMSVQRSNKHIRVQIIDDLASKTLAFAGTDDKELTAGGYGGNCEAAAKVGKAIAERAKAAGIEAVRFDRGDARYHGRVAALADAAREAGLQL